MGGPFRAHAAQPHRGAEVRGPAELVVACDPAVKQPGQAPVQEVQSDPPLLLEFDLRRDVALLAPRRVVGPKLLAPRWTTRPFRRIIQCVVADEFRRREIGTMADVPWVFLSYSHDSDEHADRVLALADDLRGRGINVILDQYVHPAPAEGWPRWMDRNLDEAQFVLMVCTETYRRRVMAQEEPGKSLGVRWEGSLIYNRIYHDKPSGSRFIPILLPGAEPAHIPNPVQGHAYYRIATFDLTDPSFEALYRHLTDQPATPRPDLGPIKRLPPKPRPQPSPAPLPPAGGPWWNVPSQGNILTRRVVEGLSRQFGGGPPVADRGTETPHEDTYLAPFLCDRNEQEVQLRRALASALAGRAGRPFVSIVHGSQDQCLDKFLERLTRVVLPSVLGRIQEETVDWPRSYQGPEHLHAWLTDRLAERFLPPEPAARLAGSGIAEVAQAIAARRAPVAIQAFFNSEDWIAGGWAMLEAFLFYWSGWPDGAARIAPTGYPRAKVPHPTGASAAPCPVPPRSLWRSQSRGEGDHPVAELHPL